MAESGIPDSWDSEVVSTQPSGELRPTGSEGLTDQTQALKLSFNPDAPAFVPGKNVFASSFVPTEPTTSSDNASESSRGTAESNQQQQSQAPQPGANDGQQQVLPGNCRISRHLIYCYI